MIASCEGVAEKLSQIFAAMNALFKHDSSYYGDGLGTARPRRLRDTLCTALYRRQAKS